MSRYQEFEVTIQQQEFYGNPRAPTLRLGRTWKTVVNAENYFMAKDVAQRMFPRDRIVTVIALPTRNKSNGANTFSSSGDGVELAGPALKRIVGALLCFLVIATIVGRIVAPSPIARPSSNWTSQPLNKDDGPIAIPMQDPSLTGKIMPPQGPDTMAPVR